jgi:hypothetical protein
MDLLARGPLVFLTVLFFLITSNVFACDAALNLDKADGFVARGTLGSPDKYVQRVYSSRGMSFSTIVLKPVPKFDKKKLLFESAKSMSATASKRSGGKKPQIQLLNQELLPLIDRRLAFLSYTKYGTDQSVNVEASGAIQAGNCWAMVRFTGLGKRTKEEALNTFAALIQNTKLEN